MAKCPFCNHFNRTDATQCEECRAPLRTEIPSGSDSTPPAPAAAPEPGSLEAEILALIQGQKRLLAVKLYRERTGVGIAEAKCFVEELRAKHGIACDGFASELLNAAVVAPEPGSLEAEILGLMQGQQKIKAIKLYRERTGVGLKEAKDFVEALAAKHGVAPSAGGCAGMVLLMLVTGAAVAGATWTLATQ